MGHHLSGRLFRKTSRGGLGGGLRGVFWRPPRHGGVYPPRRGTNQQPRGAASSPPQSTGAQGRPPIRDLPGFATGGQWSAGLGTTMAQAWMAKQIRDSGPRGPVDTNSPPGRKTGGGREVATHPLTHRHKRQRSGRPTGGCRKTLFLLLFGLISIRPPPPPPTPEDEESDHEQEESIWGWEEECISQPASAPSAGMEADTPPGSQQRTPAKPRSPPPTPLGDIEICTPIQVSKRPRLQTPGSTIPWHSVKPPGAVGTDRTPATGGQHSTPHQVGPVRTTFRTPQPNSPLSPQASVQLLASLELVAMEGESPLTPHSLNFSDSSQETRSDGSAPASPSTASTLSCSTEGSRCQTP